MTSDNATNPGAPAETYAAPPLLGTPYPHADLPHYTPHRRPRHSERIVHQIHFKIYTHANNERCLYIEEIPATGISRSRDPENFFYGLSGNWDWSCQTADYYDYWRHFFELPLVHGNNPFRPVEIDNPQPAKPVSSLSSLATLARQLSDTLTAARASGELHEVSHHLDNMPFGNAIQALRLLGEGSPS